MHVVCVYLRLCLRCWLCVGLCAHVYTHAPTVTTVCLEPSALRSIHCGHSPEPSGLTHPARPHPPPPLEASYLNATIWGDSSHPPSFPSSQAWSGSHPWREQVGGGGGRRRLGGPLEAERALYAAPSRLSLTQASSYSFAVVRRCPAVTAPPGVPGAPQPGHCASPGPGPHPVLTCCSWEHEEPHRPTHCGEAPLHHRQALTLLAPSFPRAPPWANGYRSHPLLQTPCLLLPDPYQNCTEGKGLLPSPCVPQLLTGAAGASFPAGGWAALTLLPGAALSSLCPPLPT